MTKREVNEMSMDKIWQIQPEEKEKYIASLTPELAALRIKAGISQDELSNLIGVSRQTYGSVERGTQKLSWNSFLSLILLYDSNMDTHDMLRHITSFPTDLYKKLNFEDGAVELPAFFGAADGKIFDSLDKEALRAIKTVIMLEYARCTSTPGDEVIKSFDGMTFDFRSEERDIAAAKALKNIKKKKNAK